MGIAELEPDHSRGFKVEDVLDGLTPELRDRLLDALTRKHSASDHNYVISERTIARACAEDGYVLRPRAVQRWREKHGN